MRGLRRAGACRGDDAAHSQSVVVEQLLVGLIHQRRGHERRHAAGRGGIERFEIGRLLFVVQLLIVQRDRAHANHVGIEQPRDVAVGGIEVRLTA